jgi:hypothetical protein
MAKITITVSDHPALAEPVAKTFNIENAAFNRMVQALKVKLRRGGGPRGEIEDPLTNAEALNRATKIYWDTLRQITHQYESEEAAKAAAQTVAAIDAVEE